MCKHCERLVEDRQHKQLVHDFMKMATKGVNRKLKEDGFEPTIKADDIEVTLHLLTRPLPFHNPNPLSSHSSVVNLVYRGLYDAVK